MNLQIKDLAFRYKKHPVFEHVDMALTQVNFSCIIGPNGVGKSTLLKCLNGILTPSHGTIELDGKNVQKMSLRERASHFGYVPQFTTVASGLTVLETVITGRMPKMQARASEQDVAAAENILRELNLMDFAMRDMFQLSGGERQRILVARALAQEPEIMLLDEPTSNLDLHYQLETMEIMKDMTRTKGIGVIAVIHDLNSVSRYADQVFLLGKHGMTASGTPEAVINAENMQQAFNVRSEFSEIAGHQVMVPIQSIK